MAWSQLPRESVMRSATLGTDRGPRRCWLVQIAQMKNGDRRDRRPRMVDLIKICKTEPLNKRCSYITFSSTDHVSYEIEADLGRDAAPSHAWRALQGLSLHPKSPTPMDHSLGKSGTTTCMSLSCPFDSLDTHTRTLRPSSPAGIGLRFLSHPRISLF